MTDAFAPVRSTASCTVLNTGMPSTLVPPLPGRHAGNNLGAVGNGLLGVKHRLRGR